MVLVVGDDRPFFRSLLSGLATLDMEVISSGFASFIQLAQPLDVFICVFSKNNSKRMEGFLGNWLDKIHSEQKKCTTVLVLLDCHSDEITNIAQFDHVISYANVIEPSLPSLSITQDKIVHNALVGKATETDGVFNPLWYEDCARHCLSILFQVKKNQEYSGALAYRVQDFSGAIESGILGAPLSHKLVALGKAEKNGVEGRDLSTMIELLEGVHFFQTLRKKKNEVVGQLHSVEKEKRTKSTTVIAIEGKRKKKTTFRRLQGIIFSLCVIFLLSVLVVYGAFQYIQHDIPMQLSAFLLSGQGAVVPTRLRRETELIQFLLLRFPFLFSSDDATRFYLSYVDFVQPLEENENQIQKLLGFVFLGHGTFTQQDTEKINNQLVTARENVGRLRLAIPQVESVKTGLQNQFESLGQTMPVITTLLREVPTLFGFSKSTTYAIILNDPELPRTAGGKVRSIALVSFEKGKLSEVETAQMASNSGILELTTQETNFYTAQKVSKNTSFEVSEASMSAHLQRLLEAQTHRSLDGVVGINTQVVSQVLEETGPITIGSTVFTSLNVDSKLHDLHILQEQGRDGGTTDLFWKQFVTALLSSLGEKNSGLFEIFSLEVQKRNMYFFTSNREVTDDLAQVIQMPGVELPLCPAQFRSSGGCVVFSTRQTENAFDGVLVGNSIQRKVEQKIVLSSDQALVGRTVTFKNLSTSAVWPSGTYTALLTFLLEPNSVLTSVQIDGVLKTPKEMLRMQIGNRALVGVLIRVPANAESVVALQYSLPLGVVKNQGVVYAEQNQLSVGPYEFHLDIQTPDSLPISKVAPRPSSTNRGAQFSATVDRIKLFAIGL